MASNDLHRNAFDLPISFGSGKRSTSFRIHWIDITVPISSGMALWPGDPPVSITRLKDMEQGATNNLSKIDIGIHTGTHIDAPRHFFQDGKPVTSMPIDQMIGVARVIEINHSSYITREELESCHIREGERILFKTRNSSYPWYKEPFDRNFVSISGNAADYLAKKHLKVVGIDYLSVGAFKGDGDYVHQALLKNGVWLIEGIDLSLARSGRYYLICLPLKLESAEGAPARAILRPI